MSKVFISIGIIYFIYTVIGCLVGLPLITEYLPIEFFIDIPDGATFYKIELSDIPKRIWVYDLAFGLILIFLGFLFRIKGSRVNLD